jgi:2-keto-4-pentenoate hydratase/2-oxohepta-3-ene-1,7-dioic acid hydratase in catechol pathway
MITWPAPAKRPSGRTRGKYEALQLLSQLGFVSGAYPMASETYAYEMELMVAIGKAGANVPVESAPDYIFGYAVGFDMTRRDLQLTARDRGRPWDPVRGLTGPRRSVRFIR